MLTVAARLALFVSSYAPLLALFAILESFGAGWPTVTCAAIAGVSVLSLVVLWWMVGRGVADWHTLGSARSLDADVMAFVVTYVIPFAAAQDANDKTRVALAVFAVLIAALYIRSAVFYVHPLLLLAGYHTVEAATDAGVPIILITRRRYVRQDATLRCVSVAPSVFLEKGS